MHNQFRTSRIACSVSPSRIAYRTVRQKRGLVSMQSDSEQSHQDQGGPHSRPGAGLLGCSTTAPAHASTLSSYPPLYIPAF